MQTNPHRLYELLPAIHRMRDAEQGWPLKALLQVIAEQHDLIENNIAQAYENWFIETCEDWVVPYIADLVGHEPVNEAEFHHLALPDHYARTSALIPRREVANAIRYRRRKGTLALLELLARDVAGWAARAVEFYALLGWNQALNHQHPSRGRTVDIRHRDALEFIDSPFDSLAHTVDVRSSSLWQTRGRYNIPNIGVFLCRLRPFSVTRTPAYCVETKGSSSFTFSVLGNDSQLFINPQPEPDPTHIAGELNLPMPIRRHLLATHFDDLYGENKSLFIWKGVKSTSRKKQEIMLEPLKETIIVADLSDWRYIPQKGQVAVDPVLGRIAFPGSREAPKYGVWVYYHYGFSGALGGGEYENPIYTHCGAAIYKVRQSPNAGEFKTLEKALQRWHKDGSPQAIIEIQDSGVYTEQLQIEFKQEHQSLTLRAAQRARPVIRLLDWQTNQSDALVVNGSLNSSFIIEGVMITGRSLQLAGELRKAVISHATLVPGWELDNRCRPKHASEPSLEIFSPVVCVTIDHTIIGAIQIDPTPLELSPQQTHEVESADQPCESVVQEYRLDPIRLCITDSVVDALDPDVEAIGAPGCPVAHAVVSIRRSTVFGEIHAHAIELAENTIFDGKVTVARRQQGCVRFCYVTPGSRTPPRFQCQPDLIEVDVNRSVTSDMDAAVASERQRVRPQFTSVDYGLPGYCQLAAECAPEIKRGADDESEMGVFHNLYQPQREAKLRKRLAEFVPAGADVGIIFEN